MKLLLNLTELNKLEALLLCSLHHRNRSFHGCDWLCVATVTEYVHVMFVRFIFFPQKDPISCLVFPFISYVALAATGWNNGLTVVKDITFPTLAAFVDRKT